ncbi:uncharacterized protein V6R79_014198 [Siganus canaliculatus]
MEFACSHVVCDWKPEGKDPPAAPPPLPPRRTKKARPTSLPLPSLPPTSKAPLTPPTRPPPAPPRLDKLKTNVNVVSLDVGKLVDISEVLDQESFQSPVLCGKCCAALSCLSSLQSDLWRCEFCGHENVVDDNVARACVGQRAGVHSDDLYLPMQNDDDYQNLEDTLVVFCVDISGSMSVTTEVKSSSGSTTYTSRLQGIQEALQRVLASLLKESPHRRVAMVTFNDEVVIYGDGTRTPVSIRDWSLVDHDHIWQQGVSYTVPHCVAESYQQLTQRITQLRENGATSLGPAALASVAMASRYPGSKVILCTDGRANVGLGSTEEISSDAVYFYQQLAQQAVSSGVIISVMTFEGTDCCLADIGRLADTTGGRVNVVSLGTVAAEIELASLDNVLATGVTATLLAADGIYFPYEKENDRKVVKHIGNVTLGFETTVQFAVRPEFTDVFLQRGLLPFQLQLSFKTKDQQKATRIITTQRPTASSSRIWTGSLNMAVLGVHWAQLSAGLTMDGRVQEAQRELKAQQNLLFQICKHRPMEKEESIYGNWMSTMSTICDNIGSESQTLSDEAAKVIYQMKRVTSVSKTYSNMSELQKEKVLMEGM